MRRLSLLSCALLILAVAGWQGAWAQLPKIKLPKTSQPKTQPSPTSGAQPTTSSDAQPTQPERQNETPTTAAGNSGASQDRPTINKDSLQVTAYTNGAYKGSYDTWSWVPQLEFSVNGPVASGSQLYAEFSMPGAGAWVKFDCQTEETQAGHSMHTTCGGRDGIPEDKSTLYTGVVNFAIKMRNELAGSDATLFTGRAKVGKVHSNEQGPKGANKWVYFVDQDWNLPIGYVYLTADDSRGRDKPVFNLAFWVRGEPVSFEPHLFYQGKEVGKMYFQGEEVGKAGCESELDDATTHFVDDSVPQKAKWSRVRCTFPSVRGWDKTGDGPGMFGPLYQLDKNPGDYEFKLLWNNHLARSIKFTVRPGGKLDNGVASANKLGDDRVIVPVAVIGDQDGAWDKAAWKTEAFYGNPLTGFSPPQ